jgi:hypothetical protein
MSYRYQEAVQYECINDYWLRLHPNCDSSDYSTILANYSTRRISKGSPVVILSDYTEYCTNAIYFMLHYGFRLF